MGCGCKDDAQPIMPVVRDNVPVTENDLQAKVRLLESELQMWKDSFNDLSNEYMSIVGDEEGLMPPVNTANENDNGWLPPAEKEIDVVMELRAKLLTTKDHIEICDVFDVIKIEVNQDVEGINVLEILSGVTKLNGIDIPE